MPIFVVQEHHASRLHWDFRLEIEGVLKSWAVPKGPSLDPRIKRLAIQVGGHDLEHADYEGIIPEGGYGSGAVLIWDRGAFEAVRPSDPAEGMEKGQLSFRLSGKILKGEFSLIKMKGPGREKSWLLIKKRDAYAEDGWKTPVALNPARRKELKVKVPGCQVRED